MLVLAAGFGEAGGLAAGVGGVDRDRGRGLVAAQTLILLVAGVEDAGAGSRRPGEACGRVLAGHHRLAGAGLVAHGG